MSKRMRVQQHCGGAAWCSPGAQAELEQGGGGGGGAAGEDGADCLERDQPRKSHGSLVTQLLMGRVSLRQLAERGVTLTPEEAALYQRVRGHALPAPP